MGKTSPELLNPAGTALALKQEDERLKTLDPVVITSLSFIPGKPKYLLMRGADSCALAHNIILSKEQALKLIRSLAEALIAWTRDQNVLIVSLSSGKYMEFKDFPESEWKRLRETLGFTEEKERE